MFQPVRCRAGSLAGAAESCKKGTLKVDLQALTVGVAVLSMAAWLKQARQALLQDQAGLLDSSRKLAVVNGLGEHSRAQVGLTHTAFRVTRPVCCEKLAVRQRPRHDILYSRKPRTLQLAWN